MDTTDISEGNNLYYTNARVKARLNHEIFVKHFDRETKNVWKRPIKKLCTQTKLAKQIGVTFQQIQKYEKGQNGISSTKLLKISRYFKKPLDYFTSGANELLGQDVPPNNNPTAPSIN